MQIKQTRPNLFNYWIERWIVLPLGRARIVVSSMYAKLSQPAVAVASHLTDMREKLQDARYFFVIVWTQQNYIGGN